MLPIRYRLPNPPPTFRGRREQLCWLEHTIQRAPVSVIWGPGGIGKTALVNAALHGSSSRPCPMLRLALRPGGEELRVQLVGALASAQTATPVGWTDLMSDPTALTSVLIDLAEMGNWWVVIDDLHHADPAESSELLVQLARYARTSRWICASRREPVIPELAAQVLELGAMKESALVELARDTAPHADAVEIKEAVAVAAGSPWRLQQFLAGGPMAIKTAEQLVADLSPGSVAFVTALLAPERPLPLRALSKYVSIPPQPEIDALVKRGFIERTGDSVRLHDVARGILSGDSGPNSSAVERAAALALADDEDPVVAFEGLTLCVRHSMSNELAAALDECGDRLLAHSAPRLAALLQSTDDALSVWRVRCALVMGDTDALARIDERPPGDPRDRLLWARAHLVRGELDRAAALAADVRQRAGDELDLGFEAGIIEARATMNQGRFAEGLAVLDSLETRGPERSAQRDAYAAVCRTVVDERAVAVAELERVQRQLPAVAEDARGEIEYRIAQSYYHLGHLRGASESVAGLVTRADPPLLLRSRFALLLGATVALERGQIDEERSIMARLEPYVTPGSLLRPFVDDRNLHCRLATGRLEGIAEALADALTRARVRGDANMYHSTIALRENYRLLRGKPPEDDDTEDVAGAPPAPPAMARYAELVRRRRLGRAGKLGDPPGPITETHPEFELLERLANAEDSLLRSDAEAALAQVRETIARARSTSYAAREAEARHLLCELLLVRDERIQLGAEAELLIEQGRAFPSPRFELEGRWFGMFSAPTIDVATIEHVAGRDEVAPVAARRAQALLGGDPRLDQIDRAVLAAIEARSDWSRVGRLVDAREDASRWVPGWGLDMPRKRVWLPDGRHIDLGRHPVLWRLLSFLAEHGAGSKEALAKSVWGESEYHPLRHDNRLQAAVRKLRRAIEDDPSNPTRVVTSEDGYELVGPVRKHS